MTSYARYAKRAFTLIELLVVIAIIAILAAILFPVFAQAKAAAKKAVCLSGTKQDGLAHVMYATDYDDTMMFQPVWWYYSTYDGQAGPTFWWGWYSTATTPIKVDSTRGFLSPYTKSGNIVDCPAAAGITQSFPQSGGPGLPTIAIGVNSYILSTGSGTTQTYTGIEMPAETILFGDAARWEGSPRQYYRTDGLTRPSRYNVASNYATGWVHGLHGDKANIGWVDGHSKSMPLSHPGSTADIVEQNRKAEVGYIMKAGCPFGSACQDYYYMGVNQQPAQ